MGDWTNRERPGLAEAYAAWASGRNDEGFGFAVAVCKTECGEVADALHDLHVMGFDGSGCAHNVRTVKDWGYQVAAEFVASRRGQARIRDYGLAWGHQAARDGLGLALWRNLYGCGLTDRAAAHGVSRRAYERVRDHVEYKAALLIDGFSAALFEKCTNQD